MKRFFVMILASATALLLHHFCNHVGQVALQFGRLLQTQALHQCLTVGALLPTGVHGLITTYVDIGRGEEVTGLFQHVAQELDAGLLAGTEQVAADEVLGGHLVLDTGATEPRICHHGRKDVGRELYLGNQLHATYLGIGYHLAYVILGVVAAQSSCIRT